MPFKDLDGAEWAADSILFLKSQGIVDGVTETEYKPNEAMKREEFVKLITVAFGYIGDSEVELPFSDVSTDSWYYPYVERAYVNNIINGVSENVFGVSQTISRADAAVMIHRIMKDNVWPDELIENQFDDVVSDSYYAEAVNYLKSLGCVSGVSENLFAPNKPMTRAEIAQLLYKCLQFEQ